MAVVAASPSCRHKPVYPDFGSAQLTSNPPGAEIIIDGQSTHRQTPCKIDGLAVGTHSLTLRKQWYRIARQSLTIKPGETRRQNANLQAVRHRIHNNRFDCSARDMAYDPVHERAYVATTSDGSCRAYEIRDTVAVPLFRIAIDAGQVKVAVSPAANRLFCALDDGRIAMADLSSPTTVRYLALPGAPAYRALEPSPDGSMVLAADSAGRRLVLLDARLGSVIKSIGLPAGPSDALFGPSGAEAFVTMPQTRTLARVELASGAVTATMATGNAPGELFWSVDSASICWCNRTDLSITIANVARWNAATGRLFVGGSCLTAACPTAVPEYGVVAVDGVSLNGYYQPAWGLTQIAHFTKLPGLVGKVVLSRDRRRHLVLCSGGLSVISSEY